MEIKISKKATVTIRFEKHFLGAGIRFSKRNLESNERTSDEDVERMYVLFMRFLFFIILIRAKGKKEVTDKFDDVLDLGEWYHRFTVSIDYNVIAANFLLFKENEFGVNCLTFYFQILFFRVMYSVYYERIFENIKTILGIKKPQKMWWNDESLSKEQKDKLGESYINMFKAFRELDKGGPFSWAKGDDEQWLNND